MRLEDFWALIQDSSATASGQRERTEWLTRRLAGLSGRAIIEFELNLAAQRKRADTWLMWGAAWIIMQGWCSDDGFFYFQPWLVGLGHQTFERVAGDPDSLADIPQIRPRLAGRPSSDWSDEEWPEWELLNYAARKCLRTCHRRRRRTRQRPGSTRSPPRLRRRPRGRPLELRRSRSKTRQTPTSHRAPGLNRKIANSKTDTMILI